jgi:hypothetical protein
MLFSTSIGWPNEKGVKGLMHALGHKRDFHAGGLMVLFGLIMALTRSDVWSRHVDPYGTRIRTYHFFGVILFLLGILIAAPAVVTPAARDQERVPC